MFFFWYKSWELCGVSRQQCFFLMTVRGLLSTTHLETRSACANFCWCLFKAESQVYDTTDVYTKKRSKTMKTIRNHQTGGGFDRFQSYVCTVDSEMRNATIGWKPYWKCLLKTTSKRTWVKKLKLVDEGVAVKVCQKIRFEIKRKQKLQDRKSVV